jgi:hypothetical protein
MSHPQRFDPAIENRVLTRSARRCCLCFWLDRDFSEQDSQIAHLDQDPQNGSEDNLAFLCLTHHSVYDSRTSQHKVSGHAQSILDSPVIYNFVKARLQPPFWVGEARSNRTAAESPCKILSHDTPNRSRFLATRPKRLLSNRHPTTRGIIPLIYCSDFGNTTRLL